MQKYEHSILDVCQIIHGHINGSCDGYSDKQISEFSQWLNWRITKAWDESKHYPDYDAAVLLLAYSALRLSKIYLREYKR